MKYVKPRLRYKKTRKLRFRMRGGLGENVALRVFWTGMRDIVVEAGPWLFRTAGRIFQRGATGAAREAAPAAGRAAAEAAPAASRAVAEVAAEVAAPLATRASQWLAATASAAVARAMPAVLSAGPTAMAVLSAMRPSIGRAIAADPARARNVIYHLFEGVRVGFNWLTMRGATAAATVAEEVGNPAATALGNAAATALRNAAARAATRGANPAAQAIGRLVPVVERAAVNAATVAAEAAAAVRPPIPTTGPITRAILEDLFAPEHAAGAPKRIAEFFKANPEIKVPSDFLKAVKLPAKVDGQRAEFIKQLISSGRLEGSPAELLEVASKYIGQPEAERILAGIANPAIPVRAAAEAAIKAIPEGSTRAQEIAKYMMNSLEETVTAEAKLIGEAASNAATAPKILRGTTPTDPQRLQGIMNKFLERFNNVFGSPKDIDILKTFVPTPANLAHVMGTGVPNAGIAAYNTWLRGAREHFMGQMSQEARNNFMRQMTPEVMGQFRQGMMRVFAHDAALAEEVIENFAFRVVPQLQGRTLQLNPFLQVLRSTPGDAVAVRRILADLIGTFVNEAAALALSRARAVGNLPARLLGRLAVGGLTGGVGLFAIMLQGTPNGGGLSQGGLGQTGRFAGVADAIRDRVYQWFGVLLWENPPADNSWGGQLATAAGFNGDVAAMTVWLATQGRQWLWNNMRSILSTIGVLTTAAFAYFNPPMPPTEEPPLTPEQEGELAGLVESGAREVAREVVSSSSSSSSSSAAATTGNSGGGRKKRRTVRKYR